MCSIKKYHRTEGVETSEGGSDTTATNKSAQTRRRGKSEDGTWTRATKKENLLDEVTSLRMNESIRWIVASPTETEIQQLHTIHQEEEDVNTQHDDPACNTEAKRRTRMPLKE